MAYQVGPTCYGDAVAAVSAIASAQVGSIVQHGGSAMVVDVSAVSETSITYQFRPIAGGEAVTLVQAVSLQPCGLLDWQDGLALGWGIALVWLAGAAVMALRKGAEE